MTANAPARLPVELERKLRAFERRLRGIETLVAVFAAVTGAAGAWVLLAIFDRWGDTPPAVRALLAMVAAGSLAASALWWARHWWWRRRDVRELARLVQRHYRQLGDRLLGAVELAEADLTAVGASPALVRAALRQVAEQADRYDFERAAPRRAVRRYGWTALALGVGLAAGALWAPEAIFRSLRRLVRPMAPVERYTFARIGELPDELVVARGEPFELAVGLDPRSRWRPTWAMARIGEQPPVRATVRDGVARFGFPGQTAEQWLLVHIGDDRRRVRARPLQRPELVELVARIEWPDYLRRPVEERRIERGRLAVLAEARVAFRGRAARALRQARLTGAGDAPGEPLPVESTDFVTPCRMAREWAERYRGSAERSAQLRWLWEDEHGLAQARPYVLDLILQEDAAPGVEVQGLRGAVAMLPDETLAVTVRGTDDHGVAAVGWQWRVDEAEVEWSRLPPRRQGERVAARDEEGSTRTLEGTWRFSPRLLEVAPGQVLTLWAWATDHRPGREPTRVGPYRVFVLAPEEHARLVRQMMDQLSARLDELLRAEEQQVLESDALRSLSPEELAAAAARAALERSEQTERGNEMLARQLADEIERMMREALRNPQIGADEVQPWVRAEDALRQAVADAMSRASRELARAAASSAAAARSQEARPSMGEQARQQVAEANRAQREAMEALRQTARETARQMEHAQARSFVNRLREVARMEREAASGWAGLLPALAGLTAERAAAEDRARVADVRKVHDRAKREAQYIRNDLTAFFNRTRRLIYGELREEMSAPDVLHEFAEVAAVTERLQLVRGIEGTETLAARFEAWAKRLEPDEDSEPAGAGGGDGAGEEGLEPEVLLGMMRARVVQEMLREQTRAADEAETRDRTAEIAREIGDRQRKLSHEFRELADRTRMGVVARFLNQLAGLSDEAYRRVIRPDTGPETIAVQTEIIEALASAVQGQRGGGSSSSEGQGEQQAAASAGAAAGASGGGSSAGGDTDGVERHGGLAGGAVDPRATAHLGRPDVSTWPAEFRDAIQGYYEALEGRP